MPTHDIVPPFARPVTDPEPGSRRWTLPAAGFGILSDGRGGYVDGVGGVFAAVGINPVTGNHLVRLTMLSSTKGLNGSCLPQRTGTVTLAIRHIGQDVNADDIDDTSSALRTFSISDMKVGEAGDGVISTSARYQSGTGPRFQPGPYPGSDSLVATENGPGDRHVTTQPYRHDIGYCSGSANSYWHVTIDFAIARK